VSEGKIYVFGGFDNWTAGNSVYIFDTVRMTAVIPKIEGTRPSPRPRPAAVNVDNKFISNDASEFTDV